MITRQLENVAWVQTLVTRSKKIGVKTFSIGNEKVALPIYYDVEETRLFLYVDRTDVSENIIFGKDHETLQKKLSKSVCEGLRLRQNAKWLVLSNTFPYPMGTIIYVDTTTNRVYFGDEEFRMPISDNDLAKLTLTPFTSENEKAIDKACKMRFNARNILNSKIDMLFRKKGSLMRLKKGYDVVVSIKWNPKKNGKKKSG